MGWLQRILRLFKVPPTRPGPVPPPHLPPVDSPTVPMGFLTILNEARVNHDLLPVVMDAGLIAAAAENNKAQQARGLGHHIIPPGASQNVGFNFADAATALDRWMASPLHRANLLNPFVRQMGIHKLGPWWTCNLS